jgi:tRNA threonylcarbamoyladenosine biosynthesis protein TsaE
MPTVVKPRLQPRLGVREIHIAHTDLGKSKLVRPGAQPIEQRYAIDLATDLHHTTDIHRPILESRTGLWRSEGDCAAEAGRLAARPALRDATVELEGPLGAGKTTFVRHLLRALGVQGRIKSPTYAVLEPYEVAGLAVSHLDFYRFENAREWDDAGLREVFGAPGLKLAEWPSHARGALPVPDLRITIEPRDDDARDVRLDAYTARGAELVR